MIKEPNLNGPEGMPLKDFIRNFMITVSVFDGDRLIREETIDYGNKDHRQWLGKVTFWAVSNGYAVETTKAE